MRKYRLRIGLDVDDTLYECNSYALQLLRQKYGDDPALDIDHIRGWGKLGDLSDERLGYFGDPAFVAAQPLYRGAQKFVRDLAKFADIFFITAVPPSCMSARAERLLADFPEVPAANILIGTRKDIVKLDVLLDDAAHNIADAQATYPVLLRRPWNNDLSGLLAVNTYDDFVHLARMIANAFVAKTPDLSHGGVLCLVGPSGTGKTEIAAALSARQPFLKPQTTTTRARLPEEDDSVYRFVDKQQFLQEKQRGLFVETTVYGTHFFGTSAAQFEPRVGQGGIAVLPIDICGAITLKNLYGARAMLVFCTRDRRHIVRNIVTRSIDIEDKVNRLMSLDYEMRNIELCDFALNYDEGLEACVTSILHHLRLTK